MLPATDSTAFLIGQTIGFLFAFFLLVIFPMLAILRMARHVGISGSDRVLWVVVIYCMPLFGPVTYFIWELTKGRKLRRTVPEAVRPNSGTPVAPERKANRIPSGPGLRTGSGRSSRTYPKGKGPARYGLPPRREPAPDEDTPENETAGPLPLPEAALRRYIRNSDQRRMISLDPIRFPSV